jgi:hypothetical protein
VKLKKLKIIVLVGFLAIVSGWFCLSRTQIVFAKPAFMDRYNRDEFAKPELKTKCTICHIGRGGGERNDFGDAYEDAGFRFTPKLRAKFPQMFNVPEDKSKEKPKSDKTVPKPSPSPAKKP